jgi:hypothetical protein
MKIVLTSFLIVSAAFAQADRGSIAGPVLGLVFDTDAGAVRPVLGIPGSAILGAALDGESDLRNAAVAAAGYAIGVDGDGVAVIVTAAGRRPLEGASNSASRSIVSPSGSAGALYFAGSGEAQIFTGLPDAPRLLRTIALDSQPSALALSDDGATVLTVMRSGRGAETVESYRSADPPQVVYRARHIAALAFAPGGANALVADGSAVTWISPAFGAQAIGNGSLGDVVAVAASTDGARVFIATRSGRVVIHDVASGAETSLSCACEPSTLAPQRGTAVFRLNEPGNGPLWLLDADSAEPRILFVAAPAEGSR